MRIFHPRTLALATLFPLASLSAAAAAIGACVGQDATTPADTAADAGPGGQDGAQPGNDGSGGDDDAQGTDGGADGAAPWTPAALDQADDLALWLEASSANIVLSSGTVGVWKDLSKHHNDATNPGTGPDVASGDAGVHGHDAVDFGAVNVSLEIPDSTTLQFGTDQFYIAVVAAVDPTSTGAAFFFSKATVMGGGSGPQYSGGLELFALADTIDSGASALVPEAHISTNANGVAGYDGTGFEDGNFHIAALRRTNGFELTTAIDDHPPYANSVGEYDVSVAADVLFGTFHHGNINKPVAYRLAEMVVVHGGTGIVADADVAQLHAYLKSKYGL